MTAPGLPNKHAFIGIDLAWKVDGNHSGLAVLTGDGEGVTLAAVAEGCTSLVAVCDFVAQQARPTTVVAVDCSLVVTNRSGQRACETAIAKAYGRYHASCHSTNLKSPHARVGARLIRWLGTLGFVHDFDLASAKGRGGRWLFEVYPHPSMVRLFGLERILPYKKGKVDEKRAGLRLLQGHLCTLASGRRGLRMNPTLDELLARDVEQLRGQGLKRYEDTLDAVFCAYLAWHCWRWGKERNRAYGTLGEGYVVVAGEDHEKHVP